MRKLILLIAYLVLLTSTFAQDDFLAKQYFADGDFEKAVVFYEKLVDRDPRRTDYAEGLVACYQQLERYTDAEDFLLKKIDEGNPYPTLFVELGYNYTLQDEPVKATTYYDRAILKINENPNFGYGLGFKFQQYALLDYALKAYSKAMELNPQLDYNYQKARIYGEQGDIEKMYEAYLTLIGEGKASKSNILRGIDDFISSDPENENNIKLKRILLQNAQKNPKILWNELLSWLFVQQRQYDSAFRQEKAIYKRTDGSSVQRLEGLADMAFENDAIPTATEIYEYIIANTNNEVTQLDAELNLIDIQLLNADNKKLDVIQKRYEELMNIHGYKSQTLQLQVAYANFLTFRKRYARTGNRYAQKKFGTSPERTGPCLYQIGLGRYLGIRQKI